MRSTTVCGWCLIGVGIGTCTPTLDGSLCHMITIAENTISLSDTKGHKMISCEMKHIHVLAGDIGFRVATTDGEHKAARYIEHELRRYGLESTRLEAFPCTTEAMNERFPYLLTFLGSALIAPLAPLLGLSGMIATPAAMMGEARANRGPITNLARKGI